MATAHRTVHKVSHHLALLSPEYVNFPDTDLRLEEAAVANFEVARFPQCVGMIDCTHVRIQSPGKPNFLICILGL